VTTYDFTLVLDRWPTEDEQDSLFASGCDDATFGDEQGVPVAEFDREAETPAEAVASAIQTLDRAGLRALRVIDHDLMTLADVAIRLGQSRESVRRYATGDRGPGGFPPPANPARGGTVFYRWSEIAPWVRQHLGIEVQEEDPTLAFANLILQARQYSKHVSNAELLTSLLNT